MRKVTGFNKSSKANEAAFLAAVDGVTAVCRKLLNSLVTDASPRSRAKEIAKARARATRSL